MNIVTLFPIAGLITFIAAYLVWSRALNSSTGNNVPQESILIGLQSIAILLTLTGIVLLEPISAKAIHFKLQEAAATATLFVQAMYLFGLIRHHIQGLGLFLLPVIAMVLLIIPILPDDTSTGLLQMSSALQTGHLLLSMLAYAVLTMAAFHAIMHLLLDQALKRKRIHPVIQAMPPLMKIEAMMLTLLRWSVWLIALSILTGLTWQWIDFSNFALFSHKVLLAFFSFFMLSWLLIKQKKAAWHGRRTSQFILAAYCLMLLAYFGVRLIHSWLA